MYINHNPGGFGQFIGRCTIYLVNSQLRSQGSLFCMSTFSNNKRGGKLLSGPDWITFVTVTMIYSSSPPLLLALRFWEPRDQPQPGFFLEARERILGTRFLFVYQSCLGHTSHDDIWCSVQYKYLFYKARCGQFFILFPLQNNNLDFYFSNMLINEHLTYSNHELAFIGQLY